MLHNKRLQPRYLPALPVITEYSQRLRLAFLSRQLGVPVSELEQWPGRKVEEFLTVAEAIQNSKGESDGR